MTELLSNYDERPLDRGGRAPARRCVTPVTGAALVRVSNDGPGPGRRLRVRAPGWPGPCGGLTYGQRAAMLGEC